MTLTPWPPLRGGVPSFAATKVPLFESTGRVARVKLVFFTLASSPRPVSSFVIPLRCLSFSSFCYLWFELWIQLSEAISVICKFIAFYRELFGQIFVSSLATCSWKVFLCFGFSVCLSACLCLCRRLTASPADSVLGPSPAPVTAALSGGPPRRGHPWSLFLL